MEVIYAITFASIPTLIFHVVQVVRKKRKEQTIAQLKKKLWKLVSYFVRKSAADWRGYASCFTCDKVDDWRTFDAGHFIPKSTGGAALYFNLSNIRPQCTACNRFRHGNLTVYAMKLEKEQPGILVKLHALRGQPYSKRDLEQEIENYKHKVKLLDEQKINPVSADRQLLPAHQAQETA